jgi:hypothetical protein
MLACIFLGFYPAFTAMEASSEEKISSRTRMGTLGKIKDVMSRTSFASTNLLLCLEEKAVPERISPR